MLISFIVKYVFYILLLFRKSCKIFIVIDIPLETYWHIVFLQIKNSFEMLIIK